MNEGRPQDIGTLYRLNDEFTSGYIIYPTVWRTAVAGVLTLTRQNIFKFIYCQTLVVSNPGAVPGVATITDNAGGEFTITVDTGVPLFLSIPINYMVTGNTLNFVSSVAAVNFSIGYNLIQAKGPE